jgi:hypothetical protein
MSELHYMHCCGIKEVAPIHLDDSPEDTIKSLAKRTYWGRKGLETTFEWPTNYRFLIFSQAKAKSTYGENLRKFIEDHDMGEVVVAGRGKNPNTRHILKVYVWTVDHDKVKAWLKTQKV